MYLNYKIMTVKNSLKKLIKKQKPFPCFFNDEIYIIIQY